MGLIIEFVYRFAFGLILFHIKKLLLLIKEDGAHCALPSVPSPTFQIKSPSREGKGLVWARENHKRRVASSGNNFRLSWTIVTGLLSLPKTSLFYRRTRVNALTNGKRYPSDRRSFANKVTNKEALRHRQTSLFGRRKKKSATEVSHVGPIYDDNVTTYGHGVTTIIIEHIWISHFFLRSQLSRLNYLNRDFLINHQVFFFFFL